MSASTLSWKTALGDNSVSSLRQHILVVRCSECEIDFSEGHAVNCDTVVGPLPTLEILAFGRVNGL
jgi:hypothetical protein